MLLSCHSYILLHESVSIWMKLQCCNGVLVPNHINLFPSSSYMRNFFFLFHKIMTGMCTTCKFNSPCYVLSHRGVVSCIWKSGFFHKHICTYYYNDSCFLEYETVWLHMSYDGNHTLPDVSTYVWAGSLLLWNRSQPRCPVLVFFVVLATGCYRIN